jgi:hypothetical protein
MNNEEEATTVEATSEESHEPKAADAPDEGEFKLTIRKLEMPVRPRGVLAE